MDGTFIATLEEYDESHKLHLEEGAHEIEPTDDQNVQEKHRRKEPTDDQNLQEKHRRKEKHRKKLLKEIAKAEKRGVCYLSRIPPHLKPLKLRHLLSQYGEVLRIYLAPEDVAVRLRRKMAGKKTGKNFTEGWVEFANKSIAKRVTDMLNGEPMGGKRRSAYYYDLWNIKYLKKFKWDNLTEEISYKNAVREQKLAADVSAAKRERDFYLAKVDQSKAISAMEDRKKKRQKHDESHFSKLENNEATVADTTKIVRYFSQKKSVPVRESRNAPRLSMDILAAVFGKNDV